MAKLDFAAAVAKLVEGNAHGREACKVRAIRDHFFLLQHVTVLSDFLRAVGQCHDVKRLSLVESTLHDYNSLS